MPDTPRSTPARMTSTWTTATSLARPRMAVFLQPRATGRHHRESHPRPRDLRARRRRRRDIVSGVQATGATGPDKPPAFAVIALFVLGVVAARRNDNCEYEGSPGAFDPFRHPRVYPGIMTFFGDPSLQLCVPRPPVIKPSPPQVDRSPTVVDPPDPPVVVPNPPRRIPIQWSCTCRPFRAEASSRSGRNAHPRHETVC